MTSLGTANATQYKNQAIQAVHKTDDDRLGREIGYEPQA
jgi:hypothetical protein